MSDEIRPGHIVLSTGRHLKPNFGMIGINEDGEVGEGKDGDLSDSYQQLDGNFDSFEEFTAAEHIELADIMIARWTEFKKRAAERGE